MSYNESSYVDEQNTKPGLNDIDPLTELSLDEIHSIGPYGRYPSKCFLKKIHVPPSKEGHIWLTEINENIILFTKENMESALAILAEQSTWISDYAKTLPVYLQSSLVIDWHNYILDHDVNWHCQKFGLDEKDHRNYRLSCEYENIDRTRKNIIQKLLETGCEYGLLSIFDRVNQIFAPQISYQGTAVIFGPLAASGGVWFNYRGSKITYLQQMVS